MSIFEDSFNRSIATKKLCLEVGFDSLEKMGNEIVNAILNGGKLLICGNGGSAADAQHLAAELLIRLRPMVSRQAFPAIALAMDTSTITACGNDFSFDEIFSRPLSAIGNSSDVLLVISTSGKSKNIIRAMEVANNQGLKCFAFLGGDGGEAIRNANLSYIVPSNDTASIQEAHITLGHALMLYVEERLLDA